MSHRSREAIETGNAKTPAKQVNEILEGKSAAVKIRR